MKCIRKFVLLASLPAVVLAAPLSTQHGGKGFQHLDSDGDGRVSRDEFRAAAVARADKRFAATDSDGDGYLSEQELRTGAQKLRERAEQLRNRGTN